MLVDNEPAALSVMMRIVLTGGYTPLPCRDMADVRSYFASKLARSTASVYDTRICLRIAYFCLNRHFQPPDNLLRSVPTSHLQSVQEY